MNKTLTIFTPTYNRAYILGNCYESLKRQTSKDFIWLIIDDGSIDGTRDLVRSWMDENYGFEIRYVWKENGGMHSAHNAAYRNIDTELNTCIDSDDYLTDNAVELIVNLWKSKYNSNCAGIIALDCYKDGKVIGTKLPNNEYIKLGDFYRNGGRGDKKMIYRTDLVKTVPEYPEFEGEKYVGLSYKYEIIDQKYHLLVLNENVCVVDYLPDGSSMNMVFQYYRNPNGFAFLRKESLKYEKRLIHKFRITIHYISSCFILKRVDRIWELDNKFITLLSLPLGLVLYLYIGFKVHRKK